MLFSTGGAAVKATTLSNWQVAGFRSGIAALVLFVLMPAARGRWTWPMLGLGSAYAATLILFVSATKLTTAANTIFLQSTSPLYVLLLSPWLLKEPIHRRDVVFMIILALGLGMFFIGVEQPGATAPNPARGNILAIWSGICWAMTLTGLRWLTRRDSQNAGVGATAVVVGNVMAFVVCLPLSLPVSSSTVTDWLIVVYLGIFQIGLAYVFLTSGIRHLAALEVSLLLLIEPVLNPIGAWIVHGETPGPWSLAGGIIILLATTLKTFVRAKAHD
jgi:drug/metabolite transporter (DMT)-like permease